MTTLSFRPLDLGLKGIIVFGPFILLFVSAFHFDSGGGVVSATFTAAFLVMVLFRSGVRISASEEFLRLTTFPFWTIRLRTSDVETISTRTIRPFEDFGGWGIKGSSKKGGLLLSSGGTEVLQIELGSGRRYLASVPEGEGARVVEAVRRRRGEAPRR